MAVFESGFSTRYTNLASNRFNEGKKLSTKNVKRLTIEDVPRMEDLKNDLTEKLFGDTDIYDIVYKSYLTLGIEDFSDNLVGAVCFDNQPNIKALPMWSWEGWLKNVFDLDIVKPLNSRWIQLLLFECKYISSFLSPILETIFTEHHKLKYIILAIPPGLASLPFMTESVSRILPKGCASPLTVTSLGLLSRKDFSKIYKIRKAVQEDNDDIISLIDRSSTKFTGLYGKYYISELLTQFENSSRHVVVAEYNGFAMAVMIINGTVNYELLNESFEVGPFHGFRTPDENDEYFIAADSTRHTSIAVEESESVETLSYDKTVLLPVSPAPSSAVSFEGGIKSDSSMTASESSSEDSWTLDPSLDLTTLVMTKEDDDSELDGYYKYGSQTSFLSICLLNTVDETPRLATPNRTPKSSTDTRAQGARISSALKSPIFGRPGEGKGMKKTFHVPVFHGNPNAFALEVLLADPEHQQALGLLLDAAFECFGERNYCLMCAPSMEPPLDALKDFVRITPRNHSVFPHDLFVLHRTSVDSEIDVRLTTEDDIPHIVEFLSQSIKPTNVFRQYMESVQDASGSLLSLIMTCEHQIVGLAVISQHVHLDHLIAHYMLPKWIDESKHSPESIGVLENLLIYPVFQRYCRYFLNQIHRLVDFSLLIYFVSHNDMDYAMRERPLVNCIQYLVPVAPRHMPEYDSKLIEEACFPKGYVTETGEVFSLFISMVRLMGMKRIEINTRIVVIGTGDTAMAFLETLVCGSSPDLLVTFNNITVISPHGLPFYREFTATKNMFTASRGYTIYRRVLQMNLRIHLNMVHGVLNQIKRKNKVVIVNEVTHVPYDFLVLFCGTQYRLPKLHSNKPNKFMDFPLNTFVINTDNDVLQVFNKVQQFTRYFTERRSIIEDFVIIYGKDIRAISCVAALLDHGVPPTNIAFVEPNNFQKFSRETPECAHLVFPDPEISEAVDNIIINLGIKLFKGFILTNWDISDDNKVTAVRIESKETSHQLRCKYIFVYDEKTISTKTFEAILNCGLVFDGLLVIDAKFCTNDPCIFAAGPLTKYSSKYNAEHKNHILYNSQEVGQAIGKQFREMLIPETFKQYERKIFSTDVFKRAEIKDPLPEFHRPVITNCLLPGGVFYLRVTSPGHQVPDELAMSSEKYGHLFVTGDYDNLDVQGYFRMHVGTNGMVKSICCLSKQTVDANNLINVWGKHVAILNDLQVRFETARINDFFEFFKQPSIIGIVYDKFSTLMSNVRKVFLETEVHKNATIVDIIQELYEDNDWNTLTVTQHYGLDCIMRDSSLVNIVEEMVLDYIQKNRNHLPMYAIPHLVQRMLHNHKNSPLFYK